MVGLVSRAWLLTNVAEQPNLEATMSRGHELYADSAQGRALDRHLSGENEVHLTAGITPQQVAANNCVRITIIRQQKYRIQPRTEIPPARAGARPTQQGRRSPALRGTGALRLWPVESAARRPRPSL